jgi:hypothetical protein
MGEREREERERKKRGEICTFFSLGAPFLVETKKIRREE